MYSLAFAVLLSFQVSVTPNQVTLTWQASSDLILEQSQLALATKTAAKSVPAKYQHYRRPLANNFRQVAKRIQAESLTKRQIVEATIALNQATLGEDKVHWTPALNAIAEQANEATLITKSDYIKAWLDIAEGLDVSL